MNRDFEIKQLLRAYRNGILSEAAFAEEIERFERESHEQGRAENAGFQAFGRRFGSEQEAVVSFLDDLRATQTEDAIAFAKWAGVCRTKGLRTGLAMVAERDAYHARIFERRLQELGGEARAAGNEEGTKLAELLARSDVPDIEKLVFITSRMGDPKEAVKPILQFASLLRQDIETRQALRLLAEDQMSTIGWLHELCAAIAMVHHNPPSESQPD